MAGTFQPRLIVVGVDPTPESVSALDRAVELARRFGSRLAVVVATPLPLAEPVAPARLPEPPVGGMDAAVYERAAAEELDAIRRRLEEAGVEAELVPVAGGAGDVVDVAQDRGAELIVVATRSQGLLERLVVGDPAGAVSRRATCDVLIVHHPGDPTDVVEGSP